MILRTSYFAKLQQANLSCPISIARFTPKWFEGKTYKTLAPSIDLLNRYKAGSVSIEEYTKEFNEYLSTLDVKKVEQDLIKLTKGKVGVLLCYEKPSDFCHRHLVAKWISDNLDINVTELS